MNCSTFLENLFNYAENSLPAEKRAAFENHFRSCPGCSEIVDGFLSFESLIQKEKSAEPDPFAGTRILQRLESEMERHTYRHRQQRVHLLQPVMVTLILILALLIGFVIGRQGGLKTETKVVNVRQVDNLKSDLFITDFIDEEKTLLSDK